MDPNPEIKDNYIDIYSLGCYKLVCYSFGLILGKAVIKNYNLTFEENQYLKITEFEFGDYFDFFLLLVDYLHLNLEERTSFQLKHNNEYLQNHVIVSYLPENPSINQTSDYVCYCQISENAQSGSFKLILNTNLPQKLTFILDECQIFNLICGFETLFFKVYCYKSDIYSNVKHFLQQYSIEELTDITENSSQQDIYNLLVTVINPNQRLIVSEVITRHKKDFLPWKKLLQYTNSLSLNQ